MSLFIPRVFPQIMGDMVDRLIAITPITDTNYGSVAYTMLEAAAQEDDEQYFQMLEIIRGYSLDTTSGSDLDARALEYGLTRLASQYASTQVTLGDTAIVKVETGAYSGLAGAVAGSNTINADESTGFPASGSIIIGRGTPNAETVPYASITTFVGYVRFNLSASLAYDHGTDESIILSQGGNRVITAGTVVSVPASDVNPKISFILDAAATILDGESEVTGVAVTAAETGSASNVPLGAISQFDSPPFSTATVRNPQRVTNGRDVESDPELRDRIKSTIQSLSRGTGLSIISGSIGLISPEENKRVVSAALIEPTNPAEVVKLFIDDGAASPFTFEGVGYEVVKAAATGGEIFLKSLNFPMTKAFAETQAQEPFNLVGGETLIVEVDGAAEVITFESTDFEVAGQATAQEVLERINSSAARYESRLSSGGVKTRIFARRNSNESIQVTGGTANTILNFPTDKKYTSHLYIERDNQVILLNKDGSTAQVESGASEPYNFSGTDRCLSVMVDGKANVELIWFILASDFSNPAMATALEVANVINLYLAGAYAEQSSNNTRVSLVSNMELTADSKIQVLNNFSKVLKYNGAFTDITANAATSGSNSQLFDATGDMVYLGHSDAKFRTAYFALAVAASSSMAYVAQYWNGTTWATLNLNDGTNGFQNSGHLEFPAPYNWSKTAVNGSAAYWIRIQRTGVVVTPPTESRIKISSAGDILNFGDTAKVGANKDYTLNRFLGQIELASPLLAGDKATLGSINTQAFVVSEAPLLSPTFNLSGGETLNVSVDGVAQVVTFQVGDIALAGFATAAEVAARLNLDLKGATASTLINDVKLASNKYNGGSIQVTGGTAATALGFPSGLIQALNPHIPAVESGNAEPYSFNQDDNLIVIMDQNYANNFVVPLYKQGTSMAASSTSQLEDTDLSGIFTVNDEIAGMEVLMVTGAQAGNRRTIATYNAGTGIATFTVAFGSSIGNGETYQILPKNAEQVAKLLNNKQITLLSTKAEIKISSGGVKVQVASLASGDAASVEISGGTANAVLGFPTAIKYGVDGYRYYTGLAQITQWTVDGRVDDPENYSGIRAAGVQVEVIEPIRKPVEVVLDVTTGEGVTLSAIENDIKSAVSTYINSLPIGGDVILSSIVVAVRAVTGVFDVEIVSPTANIAVADSEQARISEANISVG